MVAMAALLNSIVKSDKRAISCGATVTNISLDKALIENDESFEKLVDVFERGYGKLLMKGISEMYGAYTA